MPVQGAVLYRFGYVAGIDLIFLGQVRNGPSDFKDPIAGPGRQTESINSRLKQGFRLPIQFTKRFHFTAPHLGIAIDFSAGAKAFDLALASFCDTPANSSGRLGCWDLHKVLIRYSRHLQVQINTIQQRARDLGMISTNFAWRTTAVVFRIRMVAAGAWIHGGNQHKRGWICNA